MVPLPQAPPPVVLVVPLVELVLELPPEVPPVVLELVPADAESLLLVVAEAEVVVPAPLPPLSLPPLEPSVPEPLPMLPPPGPNPGWSSTFSPQAVPSKNIIPTA
jgi:hypothetical protein